MANQQATRVLELFFLVLSIICLGFFAYQVLFLPEVSKMGYLAGAIGFSIRTISHFRNYTKRQKAKTNSNQANP